MYMYVLKLKSVYIYILTVGGFLLKCQIILCISIPLLVWSHGPYAINYITSVYREKRIPMTALWCPAFSNHG